MIFIYNDFALVYDELMKDVDYEQWSDYIEKIFIKNAVSPSLILDLGCGTGSFCIEMTKRSYEMIGVDNSDEMLSVAKNKSIEQNCDILYLNQDITDFELYGTVDAAICMMDSVNYITSLHKLNKMFKLLNNYLNPNGIFIFDLNSTYKLKNVLPKNTYYSNNEDISYIWNSYYSKQNNICTFDLTFFLKQHNKSYKRFDETHYERAYSSSQISKVCQASGFSLEQIYNGLSFNKPHSKSTRLFYVCRKKGQRSINT